ncbi:uncharacterized [Tachysurus ichikawai]
MSVSLEMFVVFQQQQPKEQQSADCREEHHPHRDPETSRTYKYISNTHLTGGAARSHGWSLIPSAGGFRRRPRAPNH